MLRKRKESKEEERKRKEGRQENGKMGTENYFDIILWS